MLPATSSAIPNVNHFSQLLTHVHFAPAPPSEVRHLVGSLEELPHQALAAHAPKAVLRKACP